jgi:hypothetical protein
MGLYHEIDNIAIFLLEERTRRASMVERKTQPVEKETRDRRSLTMSEPKASKPVLLNRNSQCCESGYGVRRSDSDPK